MPTVLAAAFFAMMFLFDPARAGAQQPGGLSPAASFPATPSVTETTIAERHDVIGEKQHHFIGKVEMERGDTTLYADDVWFYSDRDRAIATGNVVFRQGSSQ